MMLEQDLRREAKQKGYRPEILEKVYRLLDLLETFMAVPYLRDRLVLKGGTAINLFCAEELPRLSVDLDFNYIGSVDREIMRQEKGRLENLIIELCYKKRYDLYRNPRAHAGGKMIFTYQSVLGIKGRLEVDLNYVFRIPLWQPNIRYSSNWPKRTAMTVLDIHELAAGKLHALLGREASRDLFDSHRLLTRWPIDLEKLRLAFTVYAGMERTDWQSINVDNVNFSVKNVRDKLIPVLQREHQPPTGSDKLTQWTEKLVGECKQYLTKVLPFNQNEIEFLDCLQNHGEIKPEILTNNGEFCERVKQHPLLLWRVKQVTERVV